MKRKRLIATLAFVVALLLVGAEVFLLFSAKDRHDYTVAQEQSETIAVELGLISASFNSGNKALYDEGTTRFKQTMNEFRHNDYLRYHRQDVLRALESYERALSSNAQKIDVLLELRAALKTVSTELHNLGKKTIDSAELYQVSHAFEDLSLALEKIELEDFGAVREALDNYSKEIRGLIDTAATCISVCPDSVFDEKISELNGLKDKYTESFQSLGLDFSKELSTSELITTLRGI